MLLVKIATALACAATALGQPGGRASCTETSRLLTNWDVFDFELRTEPARSNNSSGGGGGGNGTDAADATASVAFALDNRALEYRAACSARASGFAGDVEYLCAVRTAWDRASFRYSTATGRLSIQQVWRCVEEQTGFRADGGVTLHLNCTGRAGAAAPTRCAKATVAAPVESIGGYA